jgi:hypothetical protein
MADLSRNVPSAMTDFSGHIPRRVTDGSPDFFDLRAAWQKTTGKSNRKNDSNPRFEHFLRISLQSQLRELLYHVSELLEERRVTAFSSSRFRKSWDRDPPRFRWARKRG